LEYLLIDEHLEGECCGGCCCEWCSVTTGIIFDVDEVVEESVVLEPNKWPLAD
jgi:hypothetical protein